MKKFFGLLTVLALTFAASAQSRYIVRFKYKGGGPQTLSSPQSYLSQRAIDRRTRYSIPYDSTDLPVSAVYIDSVRLSGNVTILNRSKWLNGITILTTDAAAIAKIGGFSFVQSINSISPRSSDTTTVKNKFEEENGTVLLSKPAGITGDFFSYGNSDAQVRIHNGQFLHNIGLRGNGLVIGMLDAGFQNYLTVKAFDSARAAGQILGVYDFVARDSSVNEDNSHGMQCLSTIAANIPGQFVGTAPKAAFYLFRSEDAGTEYPIEEFNWVCAAERVDSCGGDLISSSLGYNLFDAPFTSYNHTYQQMNGNTTMPAIGADLAAKKGILVVNSAGNEGANAWKYLITPADGDSVVAVAAVNAGGATAGFSSYGPSSDGQVKPDLASVGVQTVVQLPSNTIGTSNGTSFACPNLAGLITCLWQGFPEFNNMRIIRALQRSGSIASAPNDRIGYGIPDMRKAVLILLKEYVTSTATPTNCNVQLKWNSKDVQGMRYELERMSAADLTFTKIADVQGSGTVFGPRSYTFNDVLANVPQGVLTYRIRQVIDSSGAGLNADYIDTVTVNLANSCGYTPADNVVLLPNPALNQTAVRINITDPIQTLTIRLFDAKGALLYEARQAKPAGVVSYAVPVYHLPKGKYYVGVYNDEKKIAVKELVKL